jgi:hypothetical protein
MAGNAPHASARTRLGRGRRGREVPAGPAAGGWTCPQCGLAARDADAVRLGFCDRCNDFTGMCAAGRKVVCPDLMSMTSWHTPCTSHGSAKWQITLTAGVQVAVLCAAHDEEVRAGRVSWMRAAVPLPAPPPRGRATRR